MKKLAISTINATSIPNFSSLQEADWIPSAGIALNAVVPRQQHNTCLDI